MATPKSDKLPFVVGTGTIISIAAIIIGGTTPEIRCKIGFISESCPAKDELVDLIVQTEKSEPLEGAKVYFISKGRLKLNIQIVMVTLKLKFHPEVILILI